MIVEKTYTIQRPAADPLDPIRTVHLVTLHEDQDYTPDDLEPVEDTNGEIRRLKPEKLREIMLAHGFDGCQGPGVCLPGVCLPGHLFIRVSFTKTVNPFD